MDRSYVRCMLIYRGCLLVKNSFVNISEVNRQCLHSLGTCSEDDFEKVSTTTVHPGKDQGIWIPGKRGLGSGPRFHHSSACKLPARVVGPCRAKELRWTFNVSSLIMII